MDDAEKITMVTILDLGQRLINELELNSVPQLAFNNVMYEMVERYHLYFGITARNLVQMILYALSDCPGDYIVLRNLRTDISNRMDGDHCKTGGKYRTLRYTLPLDKDHLSDNPPMRRIHPVSLENKSTQTNGTINDKPVMALIMQH